MMLAGHGSMNVEIKPMARNSWKEMKTYSVKLEVSLNIQRAGFDSTF